MLAVFSFFLGWSVLLFSGARGGRARPAAVDFLRDEELAAAAAAFEPTRSGLGNLIYESRSRDRVQQRSAPRRERGWRQCAKQTLETKGLGVLYLEVQLCQLPSST